MGITHRATTDWHRKNKPLSRIVIRSY